MARPRKVSLDYYPMDVDFLLQFPVRRIMRRCGAESQAVLLSLFGHIYGTNGYYLEWNDANALFVGEDSYVDESKVQEVVKEALEINFFDKSMFDAHRILTSKAIQEQYFTIVKQSRRKIQYNPAYLLANQEFISPAKSQVSPDETPVFSEETGVSAGTNGINTSESGICAEEMGISSAQTPQNKQNKTKQNEIKKDKTKQKDAEDCYPQSYPQANIGVSSIYPLVVVKDDLRRAGFTDDRKLAMLMRVVDEKGVTKPEFDRYVQESRKPTVKNPLGFLTDAILSHYRFED